MALKILQGRKNTDMRRKQIASAARKLIVKSGSEHVTVRRIAREIGVSESAIYRYFKSKGEILSFLVDQIRDTLTTDIQDVPTNTGDTLATLEGIMRKHISSLAQREGISFRVIAEIISFGDKKLNKRMDDVIDEYLARLSVILGEGVKAGVIRQDIDLDTMATLFFGAMQGLVNLWALSNYSFNLEERFFPIFALLREAIIRH